MTRAVFALVLAAASSAAAQQPTSTELAAWQRQARNVTIVRDDWGIPHIHGTTDADAVFGLMYAQAEDDFNRLETNYINAMGRLSEAEGEAQVYRDLRMKIFVDPDSMKALYRASPPWLRSLMTAYADGLNYYLYMHPQVKPRVITHFEPWMALTFSEGSIGGDIENVSLDDLAAFYGKDAPRASPPALGVTDDSEYSEPTGSNGIAIAPSNTISHHALLLINPHTTFFFRAEVQMASDEGLDAYGAVTWGQFFVYQGFNRHVGWMHSTSGADDADEYLEAVTKKGNRFQYRYGTAERPVMATTITVPYKTATGMERRVFTVYGTHHGPIVRQLDGRWVSVRMMRDPLHALMQSYLRTKAKDYRSFRQTMELHANSSNNTTFADADGDIAYFHGDFIPRRDPRFDWTKPVDGSDTATEWHGLLSVEETPHVLNPPNGWVYNSNNWPWSAAGPYSPRQDDFPAYVETGREESWRGRHALRVLSNRRHFTLDTLLAAAYDSYLPAFAEMIPALLAQCDQLPAGDPRRARVAEQIAMLRGWDYRWSVESVPTSLAVYWADDLSRRVATAAKRSGKSTDDYIVSGALAPEMLESLAAASDRLTADFGNWRTPWGAINRFQRLTGDIVQPFNDSASSLPVGFTSSRWGSLASFGARTYPGTKKMYGTNGNSFVAVVEFGDSVRARAVTAGGESGDAASPHFDDQAERYSTGNLRDVYFYASQLKGHTKRTYHPGD